MTVYVDKYQLAATVNGVTAIWSHLMAHTDDELQAFAHKLGIYRPDTHRPDVAIPRIGITNDERDRAIAAGAFEITVDQARVLAAARERIDAESIQVAEDALAGRSAITSAVRSSQHRKNPLGAAGREAHRNRRQDQIVSRA